MGKIIFLNGCGSSGKTCIAKDIQRLSQEPWLRLGVDTFIDMMPDQYLPFNEKSKEGFNFIPGKNDRGETIQIETGPYGEKVFSALPIVSRILSDIGHNLIIDEVVLNDSIIKSYINELKNQTVYFVGVFCALAVMQEREILRHDRAIGLSNAQIDIVHKGLRDYDFTVDTTRELSFEIAKKILNFIETTPCPKGFANMLNKVNK